MSLLVHPLPLGKVRLRNRLVMPPMATEKSEVRVLQRKDEGRLLWLGGR